MSVTVPVLHPSPPSFLYTSLAIDSPVQRVPGTPCYGQSPPILSTVIVESSRRTVPSPAAARVPEIEPSLLRQVLKGFKERVFLFYIFLKALTEKGHQNFLLQSVLKGHVTYPPVPRPQHQVCHALFIYNCPQGHRNR